MSSFKCSQTCISALIFLNIKQLRHDNLVNLLEVWKRRRRWYLVFEFVERTLLDDLEQNPNGLDLNTSRQYLYQILRAAAFCHQQHVSVFVWRHKRITYLKDPPKSVLCFNSSKFQES